MVQWYPIMENQMEKMEKKMEKRMESELGKLGLYRGFTIL